MVALTRTRMSEMNEKYDNLVQMFNVIQAELKGMSTRIDNLLEEIKLCDVKIEDLQGTVASKDRINEDLTVQVDDAEQYSRRLDLKIKGIALPAKGKKESEDDLLLSVRSLIDRMPDVHIQDQAIDRAHRCGKVRTVDGQKELRIIVRFSYWRYSL